MRRFHSIIPTGMRLAVLAPFALSATALASPLLIPVDDASDTFNSTSDCTDATSGNCSLREAIVLANSNPGKDTIQLHALTFALTIPASGPDDAMTGDLDITEEVTITAVSRATVDAGGAGGSFLDRIFHAHALSGTVDISHLDLKNGYVGTNSGGAVLIDSGAHVVVDDCIVTGNSAGAGGAFAVSSGAALDIDESKVSGNFAGFAAGGGIDCSGTLVIDRSTFDSNSGGIGGGLRAGVGCTAMIAKSTISNNAATNTFWGAAGGGIVVGACGSVTLENVTLSGNTAKGNGGAIATAATYGFCLQGQVHGNNVTLAFNRSDSDGDGNGDGGGIHNGGNCTTWPSNCIDFTNSIIAGNKDNGTANDCAGGAIISNGYNMVNSALCSTSTQSTDLATDPKLVPTLADNAANWTGIDNTTKTHGLVAGSPAINAGGPTCVSTDQRGVSRVGTCDRGAFEADTCGNNVARAPEECDPASATCTTTCQISQATVHNTPYATDPYKVGLLVSYERCDVPLPGLVDPVNTIASCNVKSTDPTGACEFDNTISTAKGWVDIDSASTSGGKIDFHMKLNKLLSTCTGKTFQIKVSLDETLEVCAATGKSCVIQKDQLEDLVLAGSCTVSSTGLCEFTTTWNSTSSPHKVANSHRLALEVRSVKVINQANGADAFVPGVLLK